MAARRLLTRPHRAQVTNAMAHATESLEYMAALRDPQVFRFCAIPQVMAIATLAECYDNPRVFQAVVKIPRSMRCGAGFRVPLRRTRLMGSQRQRAHHGDHAKHGRRSAVLQRICREARAEGAGDAACRAQYVALVALTRNCLWVREQVRSADPNAKAMNKALASLREALEVCAVVLRCLVPCTALTRCILPEGARLGQPGAREQGCVASWALRLGCTPADASCAVAGVFTLLLQLLLLLLAALWAGCAWGAGGLELPPVALSAGVPPVAHKAAATAAVLLATGRLLRGSGSA